MYNIYSGKKYIASFSFLKDARKFVSKVLVVDFERRGFSLTAVSFPRNLQREPQKFIFGCVGSYIVISISKS